MVILQLLKESQGSVQLYICLEKGDICGKLSEAQVSALRHFQPTALLSTDWDRMKEQCLGLWHYNGWQTGVTRGYEFSPSVLILCYHHGICDLFLTKKSLGHAWLFVWHNSEIVFHFITNWNESIILFSNVFSWSLLFCFTYPAFSHQSANFSPNSWSYSTLQIIRIYTTSPPPTGI